VLARRRVCADNPDVSAASCHEPEEPFGPHNTPGDAGEIPFEWGLDALFHIFQWLPLPELLVAHCVCKSWRRVAKHPILWKRVASVGVPSKRWPVLFDRAAAAGTVELDLRPTGLPSWSEGGLIEVATGAWDDTRV